MWTYQALTVDKQCLSNGWQRTLKYEPLNPAGSGQQPSDIRHENQPGVARCNLRNRTNRRSRQCIGLERDMTCTAPLKAWQTTERACDCRRCLVRCTHDLPVSSLISSQCVGGANSSNRRLICKVIGEVHGQCGVVCAARKLQALHPHTAD